MSIQEFAPELIAQCVYDRSKKTTFENAMALSFVSKVFYNTINSDSFLKSLVELQGGSTQDVITPSKLFKHRYEKLRLYCDSETRTVFPNTSFRSTLIGEDLEVIRFTLTEIQFFSLKDNQTLTLTLPDGLSLTTPVMSGPSVARSQEYIIVAERFLCFFTSDDLSCVAKYIPSGIIARLYVVGNRLYAVEMENSSSYLLVFDLEKPKKAPRVFKLPVNFDTPNLFFGKKHLICVGGYHRKSSFTTALSNLENGEVKFQWQEDEFFEGILKYFPYENDFLEVFCEDNGLKLSLSKLTITEDGHIRELIMEDINQVCFDDRRFDIHLQDERLLIGGRTDGINKIIAYDFISKKKTLEVAIPNTEKYRSSFLFKPLFFSQAHKICFLSSKLSFKCNPCHSKTELTTLNFKV